MSLSQPVGHIFTGNTDLDRQLRGATDKLHELSTGILGLLGNGVHILDVEVSGGSEITLRHGLGYRYTGYLITRQTDSGSVYIQNVADDPTQNILLTGSGTFTIDILVF